MKTYISIILFLISFSVFSQPAIKWQKHYGGSGNDQVGDVTNYYDAPNHAIYPTLDGGFILTGYSTSMDSDAVSNYGNNDVLLVKCDANGNKMWSNSFGGSLDDYATSVIQTSDGGFAVCGFTHSNDSNLTNNHGGYDVFIIRTDSLGNLIWSKCFGGSADERAYSILALSDNGFAVGAFSNSNDGDVGHNRGGWDYWFFRTDSLGTLTMSNTYGGSGDDWANSICRSSDAGFAISGWTTSNDSDITTNAGLTDFWIVKTDSIGTLQWQSTYGGSLNDWSTCIIPTGNKYTISGFSESNNGQVTGAHGGSDFWIIQVDSVGNLLWQTDIGGYSNDEAYEIFQSSIDHGFVAAGATRSDDGNVIGNFGNFDYLIVKLDSTGNLIWTKSIGGSGLDWAVSTMESSSGDMLVAGSTSSDDYNVESSIGGWDLWVACLTTNFNSITGRYYIDANSNSVYDAGDFPLVYKLIRDTISHQFGFTDSTGKYLVQRIDTGSYFVTPDSLHYYNIIPGNYSGNFPSMNLTDSLKDFAASSIPGIHDLQISIAPISRFRPGFNASYVISYSNVGTSTDTASILFVMDTALSFVSSTPAPISVSGDSIMWNGIILNPGQSGNIFLTTSVLSSTSIGQQLLSWASINSASPDTNIEDNLSEWYSHTTGSFDPNDKSVNTESVFTDQLSNPSYLDYVIRFQNTGNDTAFTVVVRDFISSYLDMNTFQVVSSSHQVQTSFDSDVRLLTFRFNNILLPDSSANEPESHGYIHYRVKPLSSLVVNNNILNSASIYFDYNSPVNTNTVSSLIELPTGIKFVSQSNSFNCRVFPNPASRSIFVKFDQNLKEATKSINIYNSLHEIILQLSDVKEKAILEVPISGLPNGVYFLEVISKNESGIIKFVKNE